MNNISTANKYRILCLTENQWEYTWGITGPTQCPINPAHSVNPNSVSKQDETIINSITASQSPYNMCNYSLFCDTTGGTITINLPNADKLIGKHYLIKKTDSSNSIIVDTTGMDKIDGATTISLTANNSYIVLQSQGAVDWAVLNPRMVPTLYGEVKTIDETLNTNKGNIVVANGGEFQTCPLGHDNQVMIVDSTKPLGIRWCDPRSLYARIWDQKLFTNPGGGYTANTWTTRDLNQVEGNLGVTLSNNQFTLPSGKFMLNATSPGYKINEFQITLKNVTDNNVTAIGSNGYSESSSALAVSSSTVYSYIENPENKTYEIQIFGTATQEYDGLGKPMGSTVAGVSAVYTTVNVTKIGSYL